MPSISSIGYQVPSYKPQQVAFGTKKDLNKGQEALLKDFERGYKDYNGKPLKGKMSFKKAIGYTVLAVLLASVALYKFPLKWMPKNQVGNVINNAKVKLINLVDLVKAKAKDLMPKAKETLDKGKDLAGEALEKGKELVGQGAKAAT